MLFRRNNDAAVVAQVLEGHTDAFESLVRKYLSAVHGIAYATLRNRADAEDAAQETFLKAYASLHTVNDGRRFASWLLTIARNTSISVMRQRRAVPEEAGGTAITTPDPARAELRALLKQQLDGLDDSHREILVLHYYAGMKTREIAEGLNITNEAAKKRLQRAREALGASMVRELGDELAPETPRGDRVKAIMGAIAAARPEWLAGAATGAASAATGAAVAAGTAAKATGATAASSSMLAHIIGGVGTVLVLGGVFWVAYEQANEAPAQSQQEMTSQSGDTAVPAVNASVSDTPDSGDAIVANSSAAATADDSVDDADIIPDGGRIFGTVQYDTGAIAAGVQVVLAGVERRKGFREETESDGQGRFEFTDLPAGRYGVMAFAERLFGAQAESVRPESPEAETMLELLPAGAISGRIVDENGAPVAGADLTALVYLAPGAGVQLTNGLSIPTFWADARPFVSDEAGRINMSHLWQGAWVFQVKAEGMAEIMTDPIPVDGSTATIALTEGSTIRGRVLRADTQEPVPGLEFSLAEQVVTDREGRFAVSNIAPGEYKPNLNDGPYVFEKAETIRVAEGDSVREVELFVMPGGVVSGRVVDAKTGKPLAGADVELMPSRAGMYARTETGLNGGYRFSGLRSGEYYLESASMEGYARVGFNPHHESGQHEYVVTVEAGSSAVLPDVGLEPAVLLTGSVVDHEGKPAAGISVRAIYVPKHREDGTRYYEHGRTDEDGKFEIDSVPPGVECLFSAEGGGYASDVQGPHVVPEDGMSGLQLHLDTKLASINGKILNSANEPLPNTEFLLIDPSRHGDQYQTDSGGRFAINDLRPGEYRFEQLHGHLRQEESPRITVQAGKDQSNLSIVFGSGGETIAGRITDRSGEPIAGARISAYNPQNPHGSSRTESRLDGTYKVLDLAPGSYQFRVTHEEFATLSLPDVAAGNESLDLTLEPRASIRGRVVIAATGEAAKHFDVALTSSTPDPAAQAHAMMTADYKRYNDSDGDFVLENVDNGRLFVAAKAEGFAPAGVLLEVQPGDSIDDLVLALVPQAALEGVVYDAAGDPVEGVDILAGRLRSHQLDTYFDSRFSKPPRLAVTDAEGRFRAGELPRDLSTITAVYEGYPPAYQAVALASGEITEVAVQLLPPGRIEGRISVGGQAAQGSINVIFEDGGHQSEGRAKTEDGQYVVENLPSGEATVQVSAQTASGNFVSARRKAVIAGGQTTRVDFDLGAGSAVIEGTLTTADTDIAGGMVMATSAGTGDFMQLVSRTGPDGAYRITGLTPGRWILRAASYGQNGDPQSSRAAVAEIEVASGENMVRDFYLDGTASIRGTVSRTGAQPAHVMVLPGDRRVEAAETEALGSLVVGASPVDENGRFVVPNLNAGTYTVVARSHESGTVIISQAELITIKDGSAAEVSLKMP